jgi:hypothetical protein
LTRRNKQRGLFFCASLHESRRLLLLLLLQSSAAGLRWWTAVVVNVTAEGWGILWQSLRRLVVPRRACSFAISIVISSSSSVSSKLLVWKVLLLPWWVLIGQKMEIRIPKARGEK